LLRIEGGRITLDGVDTASVPVAALRANLALIPQAPLLFSGSVRTNLDPTGALAGAPGADARAWRLLREVGLAGVVSALGGLDAQLPTGGGALAVGHKQLLSLARCGGGLGEEAGVSAG
jgi:ABC-type multidrug transport system fused ATPase/permease subunit